LNYRDASPLLYQQKGPRDKNRLARTPV